MGRGVAPDAQAGPAEEGVKRRDGASLPVRTCYVKNGIGPMWMAETRQQLADSLEPQPPRPASARKKAAEGRMVG